VEVAKQIGPLAQQVVQLSNHLERLYNSNGGPPGFLQTARKEDDGRFEMIFAILDEHKDDIKPIKDFIQEHEAREEQAEKDKGELNRKLNVKLVIGGLLLSLVTFLNGNLSGCKGAARSLLTPDANPAHSQNNAPQDVQIPPLH